jgi:hypothetical protein
MAARFYRFLAYKFSSTPRFCKRLINMKKIHLVIPDLFLPQQLAEYACKDLYLPALEKLLARANMQWLMAGSLESWLCGQFGLHEQAIAPLTLKAEGFDVQGAYYLRADPVAISMSRDEMVLQAVVALNEDEAQQLCKLLNEHFAADGMQFHAPHPQRWYLQLDAVPAMSTYLLPEVVGADMHAHLPYGEEALHWHGVLNEIQMLFFEHAVNLAREQRGEPLVSGVWLWGGGTLPEKILQPFSCVAGDSELAFAFAQAADIAVMQNYDLKQQSWQAQGDNLLLVYEDLRVALQAADIVRWRATVHHIDENIIAPLLAALHAGEIAQITLDVPNDSTSRRFSATRTSMWKFWHLSRPLLKYAYVRDIA